MGLNQTLDRLKAEREAREAMQPLYDEKIDIINQDIDTLCAEMKDKDKRIRISDYAERIFFARMLKDINPGMSEDKIDAKIERSVMIATKLYNKLYK